MTKWIWQDEVCHIIVIPNYKDKRSRTYDSSSSCLFSVRSMSINPWLSQHLSQSIVIWVTFSNTELSFGRCVNLCSQSRRSHVPHLHEYFTRVTFLDSCLCTRLEQSLGYRSPFFVTEGAGFVVTGRCLLGALSFSISKWKDSWRSSKPLCTVHNTSIVLVV